MHVKVGYCLNNNSYICIMKEFSLHIDYLILKHDCVIIPDFGGFVVRREAAKVTENGVITPPQVYVGFNPDLKYNDGLLAESYMTVYSISYDIACKKIGDVVQRLNTVLGLRQPVVIGKIGKLLLDDENRLSFIPNSDFSISHPETFGLEALDFKRLAVVAEIEKNEVVSNRKSLYQRVFAGIGAAAAAVLVFFVASTPISETNNEKQRSGFFTDVLSITPSIATKTTVPSENSTVNNDGLQPTVELLENRVNETVEASGSVSLAPNAIETSVSLPKANEKEVVKAQKEEKKQSAVKKEVVKTPRYYVIIGSATSKNEAQKLLRRLQSEGYRTASILNSNERPRIYISAFSDKAQAETYAANFRNKNPRLNDAWVYTKRN